MSPRFLPLLCLVLAGCKKNRSHTSAEVFCPGLDTTDIQVTY